MRKILSLFAAVLFAGSMMAETVTLTMEDYAATEFTASGISVTTAKNDGTNAPVYNATGKDLRVYAKGSITLSAEQNITGISFEISAQGKKRLAPLTASVGKIDVAGDPDFTAVWAGSAKEVTITVGEKAEYGTDGNTKAGQLDFTAIVVTLDDPAPVSPVGYYLVGNFSDWQIDPDYKMWENPAKAGEYMAKMFLMPEVQLKVVYSVDGEGITTWFPDGTGNAFGEHGEITEEGEYIIYFNPAGGVEGWFEGVLYAELQEPMPEIALDFSLGQVTTEDFEDFGSVDVSLFDFPNFDEEEGTPIGDGKYMNFDFYPEDANDINGTFSIVDENLDSEYTYLVVIEGTDTTFINFTEGWVTFVVTDMNEEENTATVAVTASLIGSDGNLYTVNLTKSMYYEFFEETPAEQMTCVEVYDLEKGDAVELNDVVVTYANGKNVWIKDETASLLIYLSANSSWKAGDVLSGVAGVVDIFNGVTEVKLSADQAAAVEATPGEAPAPEALETVTLADVNKYIVLKGVEAEGAFEEGKQSNLTIAGVTVRNQFKNGYTFEAGSKYDIEGVVTIYQNNPQVYFITASKSSGQGIEEILAEGKTVKVLREGQILIMKGDKTFNAVGQIVK